MIDIGLTINQPNLAVLFVHRGEFPSVNVMPTLPWVITAAKAFGVSPDRFRPHWYASSPGDINLQIQSHHLAKDAIKSARGELPVGWTVLIDYFEPEEGGEKLTKKYFEEIVDVFLDASRNDDILGIQSYSRLRVGPNGMLRPPPGSDLTEAYGSEFYPEVLEKSIRYA